MKSKRICPRISQTGKAGSRNNILNCNSNQHTTSNPQMTRQKNKKGAKGGGAKPKKFTQNPRPYNELQEATPLPRKYHQKELQNLCQRIRARQYTTLKKGNNN